MLCVAGVVLWHTIIRRCLKRMGQLLCRAPLCPDVFRLLDDCPHAALRLSRDGCVSWINETFSDLFHYTEDDCLGNHVSFLFESKSDAVRLLASCRSGYSTSTSTVSVVLYGGGSVPCSLWTCCLPSGDLLLMVDRAESPGRSDSPTAFSAGPVDNSLRYVVHELRVPLNAVSLALDVALDGGGVDEETLAVMRDSLDGASEILDGVMNMERLRSGIGLSVSEFSLSDLCSLVLRRVGAMRRGHPGVAFDIAHHLPVGLSPDSVYVSGSLTPLVQVIMNFVSNAYKFTEDGGAITYYAALSRSAPSYVAGSRAGSYLKRRVTSTSPKTLSDIVLDPPGGSPTSAMCLVIGVRDTGIGFSSESEGALFRSFSQLANERTRRGEGSGIGLSFSRIVIEDGHGGMIGAHSAGVGRGSDFFFELPARRVRVCGSAFGSSRVSSVHGSDVLPLLSGSGNSLKGPASRVREMRPISPVVESSYENSRSSST